MQFKRIGTDVVISKSAEFTRPELVEIGSHVGIDSFFYSTTAMEIGDYTHISPHVACIGGKNANIKIGNFCFVSVGARLVGASEEFFGEGLIGPLIPKQYKDNIICKPIIIEDHAGVCANVTVLPGVTIAEGCVIAAGSVVTKSTEPWSIYKGSPAKFYKHRPKEKMLAYAAKMREEEVLQNIKPQYEALKSMLENYEKE